MQIVEGIVQPMPDRTVVARIQSALQQLYLLPSQPQQYPSSPPQPSPNYVVESNVREELVGASRRSGKKKIFEGKNQGDNKFALTERANSEKSLPKKPLRKTFFNFGAE